MHIGYARISTVHQNLDMQIEALKRHGVDERNIYKDVMSSSFIKRPALQEMLEFVKPGDTVIVWRYDRIYRSPKHLLEICDFFKENSINFVSITERIDTTTPMGKVYFTITGALAQFERDLTQERVMLGLQAAKERGVKLGRPNVLREDQKEIARDLINHGKPKTYVAKMFGVSRGSIYNIMK